MKIELENDKFVYKVNWNDLIAILENLVVKSIRIDMKNQQK